MEYQNNPKGRQMYILDELNFNLSLSFSDMFSKCSEKFGISQVTFNKDWLKASKSLKQYQETINKAKLKESIKIEKQAVRKAILSKHQALEILTEIAEGNQKKVGRQIVMPSFNERTTAIKTMAGFEGWNAPIKTENTNMEINPEEREARIAALIAKAIKGV